jgi:hypothetical protein
MRRCNRVLIKVFGIELHCGVLALKSEDPRVVQPAYPVNHPQLYVVFTYSSVFSGVFLSIPSLFKCISKSVLLLLHFPYSIICILFLWVHPRGIARNSKYGCKLHESGQEPEALPKVFRRLPLKNFANALILPYTRRFPFPS